MKRIFFLFTLFALTFSVYAQNPQVLPLEPKVKSGKLENGLTYFVMKNSEPKVRQNFTSFKSRLHSRRGTREVWPISLNTWHSTALKISPGQQHNFISRNNRRKFGANLNATLQLTKLFKYIQCSC